MWLFSGKDFKTVIWIHVYFEEEHQEGREEAKQREGAAEGHSVLGVWGASGRHPRPCTAHPYRAKKLGDYPLIPVSHLLRAA